MFPSSFCGAVASPPLLLPYDRLSYQQATSRVHLAPSEISVRAGTRIIENVSPILAGSVSRNDLIHRVGKVLKPPDCLSCGLRKANLHPRHWDLMMRQR